jgi:hypothetical protein
MQYVAHDNMLKCLLICKSVTAYTTIQVSSILAYWSPVQVVIESNPGQIFFSPQNCNVVLNYAKNYCTKDWYFSKIYYHTAL